MLVTATVIGCGGGEEVDDTSASSSKPQTESKDTSDADTSGDADTDSSAAMETSETETPTTEEASEAAAPAETSAKEPADPNATGSFSGTIVLDGDAPQLDPLVKAGDEAVKDKEVCGAADVPDQSLVVGEGNGIANVFVYLRRAPKGYKSEVPEEPVVLDQKGCVFLPHVALIHAGQKVLVKSSDPIQHNIHTFPNRNQGTNLLINPNDQTGIEIVYDRPETEPIQVKCDIHAWMASWHLILDHPFMAVTDANGNFSVDGLPAGDYEFRVWHERGGLLEKEYKVTVTGDDEPVTLKYAIN
jgi:hypothetical protein